MQLRVRAWVCVRACVRVSAPTRGLERARACVCVRIMRACESPCVSVRAPAGAHGCVHARACTFRRARVCGREGATDVHLVCVERRAVEVPIAHLRRDRESAWAQMRGCATRPRSRSSQSSRGSTHESTHQRTRTGAHAQTLCARTQTQGRTASARLTMSSASAGSPAAVAPAWLLALAGITPTCRR